MSVWLSSTIRWACLSALTLAGWGAPAGADEEPTDKSKPNVIVFFTDDQGTLDANCYGSKDLHTPAMDELARTGVRFTQAYAHTVCCPARALLMTGRHPQRSGVNHWTQQHGLVKQGVNMARAEITIAEMLKAGGYRTALFGKWHLGSASGYGPTAQGFDAFFGLRGGFIENYTHYGLDGLGVHDLYEGEKEIFAKGEYFPDLMTDRTVRFLEQNKDRPFFVYVPFNIPHFPEQQDKKFDERYKDYPMPRKSYARVVSTADDRMGRIMAKLDELGLRDNTIIIFMSDNGHSVEKGRVDTITTDKHKSGLPKGFYYGSNNGGGNTGKWIGSKGSFHEGGIRVPAIISYPAGLPQGITRDQAITAADWLPTIAALCDVPLPQTKLDGQSLLPIIRSEDTPTHHKTMHWQWQNRWAVREGPWKLIGAGKQPQHLGNLDDPKPEVANYVKLKPDLVERLHRLHEEWRGEVMPEKSN